MRYKVILRLCLLVVTGTLMAQQRVEPYSGSRIFWDVSSERTIFAPGNYARMIQLQDGRLMAVAQSSGAIRVSTSNNLGDTWSPRVIVAQSPTGIANAVPDIYQLKDGIILVGYNPRPNQPYSEERKFGIRARRSTDNGQTWSAPEIVFFRANHRDGMPAPVLLAGSNEIVVIIEDNGYPGGYSPRFQPVTVRTSLEDNWKGGFVKAVSPAREYALETPLAPSINAAAPYLRQLSSGETILSYHGSENRPAGDNFQEMFVLVGNPQARKFKAKSNPFALPEANRGMWNSVSVIENDVVVAITSTNLYNTSGGNDIVMLKGYPLNKITIKKRIC